MTVGQIKKIICKHGNLVEDIWYLEPAARAIKRVVDKEIFAARSLTVGGKK